MVILFETTVQTVGTMGN